MKKFISKFIRIASEGATIDGREITADQITKMAANCNPATYGARIWIEHFRGLLPDSMFPALGDVVSLKAEKGSDGKLALFAQLRPNAKFLEINKEGQKVFTSIEMDPNFSGTGEPYLVGLAVTDSPASLGTEMLAFSRQHLQDLPAALAAKLPQHPVTAPIEAGPLEFSEEQPPADAPSLLSRITDILGRTDKKADGRFADLTQSVVALAESVETIQADMEKLSASPTTPDTPLATQVDAIAKDLALLTRKLGQEPDPATPVRPLSTGFSTAEQTDC